MSLIEILGYGGVIPAAISIAIVFLLLRFAPAGVADRYATAAGFSTAFIVGYALLPSWAALQVSRHWHWLPYLSAVAMVLGPIALAEGIRSAERWILHLLLALLAAWLLVPTWSDLEPSRPVHIALLTGYLWLLTVLMDLLVDRLSGPLVLVPLSVVAGTAAIMLAYFVSLKFGQIAGVASAALAGCAVAGRWHNRDGVARGLVPAFVVVIGGAVFVGYIEPQPPLTGMLLLPAAPLALWSCVWGPLARLRGMSAVAAQTSVLLVALVIALVLLLIAD